MNPFERAVNIIDELGNSGAAEGLAKLILTFYNYVHPFSFRECIRSLDDDNIALALEMINYFVAHGEDASVIKAGETIRESWPHLMELSSAGSHAKADVLSKWREILTEDIPD
jgi:hypothetical protein